AQTLANRAVCPVAATNVTEFTALVFLCFSQRRLHALLFCPELNELCIPLHAHAHFFQAFDQQAFVIILGKAKNKWIWAEIGANIVERKIGDHTASLAQMA